MEAALRKVKTEVDPKQFQVFDCYVMKGWPVREVASALGVSANQVYLARSRVGAAVKLEVERLRREMV
jgi:RNA polymerase sigma-70 factor (ECF subfamily)